MKRKLAKAERAQMEADRHRAIENAKRTRELAERGQAKLDAERRLSNTG